ncbi:MAG: hypothetical protein RL283_1095 [Actinomycetota bacterium]
MARVAHAALTRAAVIGVGVGGTMSTAAGNARTITTCIGADAKSEPTCRGLTVTVLLVGYFATIPLASVNCVPSWNSWYHAYASSDSVDVHIGASAHDPGTRPLRQAW